MSGRFSALLLSICLAALTLAGGEAGDNGESNHGTHQHAGNDDNAPSSGLVSTMIKPIKAGPEEAGMRLVRADDLGGESGPGLLAPTQAFEILRPDMEEITIKRLGTSCSCIRVVAEKKTFAKGERAILELRNITPTKPKGMNYAIYVQISEPEPAILRLTTFVRSEVKTDAEKSIP